MRLQALDQIHVSAVQADTLRPGQEFDISDEAGADLLKRHPTTFKRLAKPKAAPKPANKAAPKAANKAAAK